MKKILEFFGFLFEIIGNITRNILFAPVCLILCITFLAIGDGYSLNIWNILGFILAGCLTLSILVFSIKTTIQDVKRNGWFFQRWFKKK